MAALLEKMVLMLAEQKVVMMVVPMAVLSVPTV